MLAIAIKRYFSFPKSPAGAIWDNPLFMDGARAGAY
jgi:hypothetical protein